MIDPWGKLLVTGHQFEMEPFRITLWQQSERNPSSQQSNQPLNP